MHVIYGGTFDPVHHGHLRLGLEISDALAVDRVHLLPCHIPPHRGNTGATSEQRLELIRLAINGEHRLCVDDRELHRAGASYTADTLRQLRAELGPEMPLVMVVGTDAFAAFDRWREWVDIPALAHIVVVQRPGAGIPVGSQAARLLAERSVPGPEALRASPCGAILQLNPPLLDISATGIRQRIASGRSPRYLTPDPVWQRIQSLRLYGACPAGNF
ncbi:nicotinate-nucleotide adenylyltransferase [Marinobacter sp.]|uniref:nicotinate-nucleotide adenylyltransferase n=1 Tax=Marinobacter sp. TaxID=50741 RepID=UPI0019E47AA9|nr:nicotinate-nucleotide adenylyltransferase [Marinobacter sp.]MBE0484956.1 nicotinate-nucleotide adenylyltransferase [Marinobacter sp.]